jgi:hypothetical protein
MLPGYLLPCPCGGTGDLLQCTISCGNRVGENESAVQNIPGNVPDKNKKRLCGGDRCCDRLNLGLDDLDTAGRVQGLYGLEEIF